MNSVNNEATHTNLKSSEEATKGKSSRNNERRGLIKPGYEYNPVVKYLGFHCSFPITMFFGLTQKASIQFLYLMKK